MKYGLVRVLLIYAAGAVAGGLLSLTSVPMPWLIGPMAVATAHCIGCGTLRLPAFARPAGQMIIAGVVGMAFTATALAAAIDHIGIMLIAALATVLCGFITATILGRLSGIDPVSACISSVPGGPVEMSTFAINQGVPPAPVAFIQTLRIAFLVLTIPSMLVALSNNIADPTGIAIKGPPDIEGSLLLLSLSIVGGLTFFKLRLTSPFFLGALAFTATASATSLPVAMPPYWLLCTAQVLLGISLGNMFERRIFTGMGSFLPAACVSTIVLIILSAMTALALSALTGLPWETMILSTSPGGITEMALTAQTLNQDPALVSAFHLVRIFTVMPLAPLIFGLVARVTNSHTPTD